MLNAARNGDAKAALEILKHTHGWVAKQAVSIEVDQRISVIDALRAAETRVDEGKVIDVLPDNTPQIDVLKIENKQVVG
jgi:hypothetical protein